MNRRAMLKTVALAASATAVAQRLWGQRAESPDRTTVLRYLDSLARDDGGYAWEDQMASHLTPTFAAIGCFHLLKTSVPRRAPLAEFIRTHHPTTLKKLEQEHRIFDYQQVQSLQWLGEDTTTFREKVMAWKKPVAYLKQYEQHGYPVFQSEMAALLCRSLLSLPGGNVSAELADYLLSRRRQNGTFNNTPAADGSDGHVINTWWGLQGLQALQHDLKPAEPLVEWLRQCQRPGGGFTFAPNPDFGGVEDVAYTRAAVRALQLLGAQPIDRERCLSFMRSLQNPDGGFADRPGWLSNPLATYHALDTLLALGAENEILRPAPRQARAPVALPAKLKVFSIQIEAPGQGSPADAVQLARDLRIHLWGAKNARPEWLARAQAVAGEQAVPVQFFVSNEEYGTWLNVPGLGTYSHMSDVIAPRGAALGAAMNSSTGVTWKEFRERRLTPLTQANGRLVWQFGENEELARMLLDDSLDRPGFAAISTFHFGNPDFTNSEPFLQRWRGQIPFVALQDAHAAEAWWGSDCLAGFRTLFLAQQPTWEGWLNALKNNWVVAVRHDAVSAYQTWLHSGSRTVLDHIREREAEWKWWSQPHILKRPLAAIAYLQPSDKFEAGALEKDAALRIRCWWDCTIHGLLKKPMVELKSLSLDGQELKTVRKETRNGQGALTDSYYLAEVGQLERGNHTARASLQLLATGERALQEMRFAV